MKTGELPIARPCDKDWATMNPRETGRFCSDCKKVVQDLSSMREGDAKKRVAEAREGLCIRYLHDEHGNVWFADTRLTPPRSLLRKGAGLAALALMPILTACMGSAVEGDETLTAAPPQTPDARDAGGDARTSADPVVDTDAGSDGESDGESDAAADAGSD